MNLTFRAVLIAVVLAGSVSTPSFAGHKNGNWAADLGIGVTMPVGDELISSIADPSLAGAVGFRRYFTDTFSLGLGYNYLSFADTSLKDHIASVLGRFDFCTFKDGSNFFFHFGPGWAFVSSPSYSQFTGMAGIGLNAKLSNVVSLTPVVNFHHVLSDSAIANASQSVLTGLLGLTFNFGQADEPAPQPVVQQPKPIGKAPKDTDGDGVMDEDDKCPGTPAGKKVNPLGCVEGQKASIRLDVKFATGKTTIDPAFVTGMDEVGRIMKKYENIETTIEGHTDNVGSPQNNQKLSQARAEAVKGWLVSKHGIDAKRLSVVGHGDTKPVGDNKTAAGRKLNRRVQADLNFVTED